MEVHQHTHTPDNYRDRKKWTHYFWEFFMLFLAVIAGFLVENQREHYIEQKRAKVLASSIYDDLKSDTVALNTILQFTDNRNNHLDSLKLELKKIPAVKNDSALSLHTFWLVRFQFFARSKATYEQVKNSGMLRYFDLKLVNLLTAYDVLAEEAKLREDGEYSILLQIITYVQSIMNFESVYSFSFNKPLPEDLYFNITDRAGANLLINKAMGVKINRTRLKQQYEKMQQKAGEILKIIKKKYHLE